MKKRREFRRRENSFIGNFNLSSFERFLLKRGDRFPIFPPIDIEWISNHRRDRHALKVTFTTLLGAARTRPCDREAAIRARSVYARSLPDDSLYFRNSNPKVHSRVAQQRVTITFLFRRHSPRFFSLKGRDRSE